MSDIEVCSSPLRDDIIHLLDFFEDQFGPGSDWHQRITSMLERMDNVEVVKHYETRLFAEDNGNGEYEYEVELFIVTDKPED
jgi:hypothetical protein